ncbi:MAG: MFS transporter [Planctomycetes bacterium]|nr:MFS transporter [Planctomycetota bacterium]
MVNRNRLLWAGFMAIFAAGVGFAIRGGIFDNWKAEFGFTDQQLGAIGGAGFTGFCFGIILGGVIADRIGYGKLVFVAFVLHILSAVITFAASPSMSQHTAYLTLVWGMFIFSYANGTLEAVCNPVVSTLFPENRTHYLNILHASWPGGMILGTIAGWILDDAYEVHWKIQLSLYLAPTVLYGVMFMGQKQPASEASEKGLSLGEMFKDVGVLGGLVACFLLALFFNGPLGLDQTSSYAIALVLLVGLGFLTRTKTSLSMDSLAALVVCTLIAIYFQQALSLPLLSVMIIGGALLLALGKVMSWAVGAFLLFVLFVAHMLVGAVELGTDGWIQNITGNLLISWQGKALFIWTNVIMFSLRFCAHFIEKKLKLSPVGILLTCACLAVVGLLLASRIDSFGFALLALGIYAVGKTFYWPTQLAVIGDRFPRTGAVAISMTAGIGMLSAGLIGSVGLGYAKDRFASEALQKADPALFSQVKADKSGKFLFFGDIFGLDGKKVGDVNERLGAKRKELAKSGVSDPKAAYDKVDPNDRKILEANIAGDRNTLVADAFIPSMMALIYLGILLYFKTIGGYKAVKIDGDAAPPA